MRIHERAERLKAAGGFLAGPLQDFEKSGRLQLATLLLEGVYPSSKVLDVGCGSLRAGYWIMNFLEPGCYFGIEPREWEVREGLEHIVEPELVEYARPQFAHNDDFDLTVFGVQFDFVVARSIWSHTSKAQIEAMLDSFVHAGAPGSVLLASYLPASRIPDAIREPLYTGMRKVPKLVTTLRDIRGKRLAPGDYLGDEWQAALIGHRRSWLREQCERRGFTMRELPHLFSGSQVWARIDHP
ncbi:MAG TPA: class I SAM-dependent methyltransferase [Acidimicrobiia bacterium]|nr:class I SAM-dependent methyltransferase [Acidimicrobiia bacterium]